MKYFKSHHEYKNEKKKKLNKNSNNNSGKRRQTYRKQNSPKIAYAFSDIQKRFT